MHAECTRERPFTVLEKQSKVTIRVIVIVIEKKIAIPNPRRAYYKAIGRTVT